MPTQKRSAKSTTDGATKLRQIVDATSLTAVARRLSAIGVPCSPSNVLGWTRTIRPRDEVRIGLEKIYGLPRDAWLSDAAKQIARS